MTTDNPARTRAALRAALASARRRGISVHIAARASDALRMAGVIAEYRPRPAAICLYRDAVRRVAAGCGMPPRVVLLEALLHELAHHTEPPRMSRPAAEARARRLARRLSGAGRPRTLPA